MNNHRNETIENYLEAIHILTLKNNNVRAIDIVQYLNYSRPTVSVALKNLQLAGYVNIDNNIITLTELGLSVAEHTYERHELIAGILIDLGVSKDVAYEDSCKIEHDLSDESFKAIKEYYCKIKNAK